ncbi:MAG: PEP-CTERM sorting domain-containing protein [Okeania sp. SIO1H6]|nr:PEP-CTERM sorting domain-containing protein [Okeania sp. SIO1H6]
MCTKITRRTKTLLATAATSAVLLFSGVSSAEAFTLLYEDPSDTQKVTGIEDLMIDGTEYDVSFEFGTFNDVFGNTGDLIELEGKTPEFWGNIYGAHNAGQDIIDALGEDSYLYSIPSSNSDSIWRSDRFFVPYLSLFTQQFVNMYTDFWPATEKDQIYSMSILPNYSNYSSTYPIATFDSEVDESDRVPEPSLILGLMGLGGLILRDKRKTRD